MFQVNDKLEAVDRRNTQLICPASIGAVNSQHVLISFDGWSGAFDYWTRFDSRELFPVGWCKAADYPLQSPGPNAIRSPSSHSTPSISHLSFGNLRSPSLLDKHPQQLDQQKQQQKRKRSVTSKAKDHFIDNELQNNDEEVKKMANPIVRRKSFSSSRRSLKSYSNRSRLFKSVKKTNANLSVSTPYPSKSVVDKNHTRNSYPPSLAKMTPSNPWSGYSGRIDSDEVFSLNLDVSSQRESNDSSAQSLSSPPIIHPVSEAPRQLYPLDHPPCIEAAIPMPKSRHRRASSSECIVRLQAKTSNPMFSSAESITQPELKSWQVVTEPRFKVKKIKSDKGYNFIDKDGSVLKKKFKLVK